MVVKLEGFIKAWNFIVGT